MTTQIILGLDFGLKHIGVAIGQCITQSANPLCVLKAKNGVPDWKALAALIAEWGADTLVIGLPLNMDGTEQPITQRAREFADALKTRCQLPVFLMDERLTTVSAKAQMHDTKKGAARFERADSVSAQLILESWMQQAL